jgi:O-succinylbenzoic acid--CoA ligase
MPPGPFTPGVFAATAARLDPTERHYTALVPTQLRRLLASPVGRAALQGFDAVLVGGAALLDDDVPENVITTYGLTESCSGCVYNGVPLDHAKVEIDADRRILLSGPMLADGYSDGDDEAWLSRGGERWFRTSDLGEWVDGRLSLWGRADTVIVTGGHKTHPAAVERELVRLPGVADAVVVGVADPEWGERVAAVVEPEPGLEPPTLETVRDVLASALERHELPRTLTVVRSLPRLPGGKIDRGAATRLAE